MKNKSIVKKILIVVVICILILLVGVLCRNCFFEDTDNRTTDKVIQDKTSRDDMFYINYSSDSKIKSGTPVKVGDVIKYQASYVNNSDTETNTTVSINLSKGLEYVANSSSVGEPTITKNDDGSSVLVFKRTLLKGIKETLNFDCKVSKNASDDVFLTMDFIDNKKNNKTEKLTNKVEDFIITYKKGAEGKITSKSSEKVKYGNSIKGVDITPNSGYELVGFVSDKDVLLNTKDTIKSGELIKLSLLKDIVVNDDIVLTASYGAVKDQYLVTYLVNNKRNSTERVIKGQKLVLKQVTMSKNCVVKKWSSEGKVYNSGDKIKVNKNMTFVGNASCLAKSINNKNSKVNKDRYDKSSKHSNKLIIVIMSVVIILCLIALYGVNRKQVNK